MAKLLVPKHIAELPPVHQLPAGGAVIKMIHLPRQIGRGDAERVQFGSIRRWFAALLVHSKWNTGAAAPVPVPDHTVSGGHMADDKSNPGNWIALVSRAARRTDAARGAGVAEAGGLGD